MELTEELNKHLCSFYEERFWLLAAFIGGAVTTCLSSFSNAGIRVAFQPWFLFCDHGLVVSCFFHQWLPIS